MAVLTKIIVGLLMVFSGFYTLVLRGEICQNAMDLGKLSQDAFTVGGKRESGRAFFSDYNNKRRTQEKSIGIFISSMAVSFALINTLLVQFGER